jgi:hypothetical protein
MFGVSDCEATSFCFEHAEEKVRVALLRMLAPEAERTAETRERLLFNLIAMLKEFN